MRTPVLTYQSMRIGGAQYAANDLVALAADLRQIAAAGLRIVPLKRVVDALTKTGTTEGLGRCVALACDAGSDFDFRDLEHPTAGVQRSVLNTLRDFAAEHPEATPHITSFVVASPAARAALDRACMVGRGWWSDDWWAEAVASGLMHIGNNSWDHNHESLPESFSQGARSGTFATIDTERLADHEIRQAAEFLRARAPNPGTALFAYPYGYANAYLSGEYFPRFGAELGIEAAFTDRAGFVEAGVDRWQLPRFVCGRDWTSPFGLGAILNAAADLARPWRNPRDAAPMMAPPKRRAAAAVAPAVIPKHLRVSFEAPPSGEPARGLVPLQFDIEGPPPRDGPAYQLTVESEDGALRYSRAIDLASGSCRISPCINSHLLPDGASRIHARLMQGGARTLWNGSFDLQVANRGPLGEKVRASLRDFDTPAVLDTPLDSASFDIGNAALAPWFDRPDALAELARRRSEGSIGAHEEAALRQFVEEGYAILPVPLDETLLAKIDGELDHAIASRVEGYEYGTSQRIHNLHHFYPGVRSLWKHPMVMRYLELIFGVPARPCQSLTYVFGSQQGAHQDTIHLTPFPAGYMCGVWVALEDVQPQSGELEIYRGSHRLPRVYMSGSGCAKVLDDDWSQFGATVAARWRSMLEGGRFGKLIYRPKRGTVLIWHENLMHAGGVRVDHSLSRRSIVSHYFAEGSIAFYDSSGMPGHME